MLTHAAKTHSLDNGGEPALLFLINTKDGQVGNINLKMPLGVGFAS